MTLLAAILILLRSATKITHKAQAITCLASKWHICATLDSFDAVDGETPTAHATSHQAFPAGAEVESGDDDDDEDGEEDDVDNTKFIPAYAYSTISFQKRQALGKLAPQDVTCIYVLSTNVIY